VDALTKISGVKRVERQGDRIVVYGNAKLLAPVAAELAVQGVNPSDFRTGQANLEDVFLTLTGRKLRD
jgi:ABC-2 type transport system ATP-binding protein